MGNDYSQLAGIDIDEKAVEISDFWSHHTATVLNSKQVTNISVFIGEVFVSGSLWSNYTPLEKCSKNIMIYRHPSILRYVSSWQKNSKFYLAVEDVKPLSHILSTLNTLQRCIGLHSILKALCFLHERALVSHNNVCLSSIYIGSDGNWKLGGMEYLCKYSEFKWDYLSKTKSNRYNKALDPNEKQHVENNNVKRDFVDVYAYCLLVLEVLKTVTDDDVPALSSFYDLCKSAMSNVNATERPSLQNLLDHDFFNHGFIVIHSFLNDLPLKSDEEKTIFFSSISDKLREFNELTVAIQMGSLLVSRMVLLNKTAQSNLLPNVLGYHQDEELGCLFSEETFKKFIVPKLLDIFCVRDAQIRLLLLNHFKSYVNAFSEEELQSNILPELLLGIKDTNDILVAATLQALALLVPVLGAGTVIGGKRAKLFTDGRPLSYSHLRSRKSSVKRIENHDTIINSLVVTELTVDQTSQGSSNGSPSQVISLPERQRPDGEEVETSTEEVEASIDEELDWEDWNIREQEAVSDPHNSLSSLEHNEENLLSNEDIHDIKLSNLVPKKSTDFIKNKILPSIDELDIKHQKNSDPTDDIDFFQDMEPQIQCSVKFLVNESGNDLSDNLSKLRLKATDDQEEGWGGGEWD